LTEDERALLRSAVRDALSERDWLQAARETLDGAPPPDGWPIAVRAGWPGLLVGEEDGGAGLTAAEALLVARELGRALAGVPLLGHMVATALMSAVAPDSRGLAAGDARAAWLPARAESDGSLSVDPIAGAARSRGLRIDVHGRVTGTLGWVPDAPGADLLVGSAAGDGDRLWTVAVAAADARIQETAGYDGSRRHAHVFLEGAPARSWAAPAASPEDAWALAQALLGAEALGAAERLLDLTVDHARSRFAFGRVIGSFQAVKHQLVEVLRRVENSRVLVHRAGAAITAGEPDRHVMACALRFSAGDALDCASRTAIAVHGGLGATWEHPAALYFRRAQVTRRLLGGHGAAATEVGRRLLTAAA
jgi:alkylation response protein AidB-like acyl-CoA dehydrogenase